MYYVEFIVFSGMMDLSDNGKADDITLSLSDVLDMGDDSGTLVIDTDDGDVITLTDDDSIWSQIGDSSYENSEGATVVITGEGSVDIDSKEDISANDPTVAVTVDENVPVVI